MLGDNINGSYTSRNWQKVNDPFSNNYIIGVLVTVSICHIRDHGFDTCRRTPSKRNGQRHWFYLANIEGNRILTSHQGGSMMSPSIQEERWKI